MHIRPAAVAGLFYPDASGFLSGEITQLFAESGQKAAKSRLRPKAIIAPHAGYVYSGPIAASVYATLEGVRDVVRRVILLGPTHRVAVDGLAVPSYDAFSTPLGTVRIDKAGIKAISDLPQVVLSDEAHALEHSLEVQLPFLQSVLDDFSLVPLAVGQASPFEVNEVIERLWGGDETLIVVSSDLSHYLSYEDARQIDTQTAQRILNFCPTINHYQACGATPVNGLLLAARQHGLRAVQLDLRNSGDTSGDKSRVVGYGAFAFVEPAHGGNQHAH
ncbi:AmmeMemoRadiSam system protein B [Propionivibrio limicola]|uniref:AmmeMemoRadiSam system protein B n=1 Tax=Propionivibrio limicola TaxID=167645 RepID=UPI0031B6359E